MKLQSIVMPLSEFDHAEKGDALYGNTSFLIILRYFESNVKILSVDGV